MKQLNITKKKLAIGLGAIGAVGATVLITTQINAGNKRTQQELAELKEKLEQKDQELRVREENLKKKIAVSKKEFEEKEEQLMEREILAKKLVGKDNEIALALMANIQKELREIKKATEYTREELRISNSLGEYSREQKK